MKQVGVQTAVRAGVGGQVGDLPASNPAPVAQSVTKIVGTGADDASTGFVAWSNPTRITADDGSFATAVLEDGDVTHFLKGTMGANVFAVPLDATIDGITVSAELDSVHGLGATTTTVKLVVGDTVSGNNLTDSLSWPATPTLRDFGGAAELWGLVLTPADVNAADFGAVIQAEGVTNLDTAGVDCMQITIHYTA